MKETSAIGPRERLLDAAEQLIYESSIHATGVDAIVRQSGTARKSFYTYFASKEDLVTQALRRRDDRWMAWFERETLRSAPQPAAQLLGMFDVLHTWFCRDDFHGCVFLNVAGQTKPSDIAMLDVSRLHKRRLLAFIESLCRAAGATDAAVLARQLLLLVDGAISVALVSGQASAAGDARRAAECLLGGASTRPAVRARRAESREPGKGG
ncbi:TetR/AcrR family transcriptional regulator [Pandoraea sp.]|uniref:TetR/AcrR family transcriptional regulator n=1 Tax=Pandoraea sp. TaxID=1883445 RepID=UPI001217BDEC|nr:TetR/AcrR family transcriptional regulator [Pandoraea sp.]TAL56251.1 MAG: TetR/AcrR family transcriptional regulator [Pandoraea sp.]TAM19206.1 MAG: TetR/AcrR family transcriptional regulator [Pandoraea sp.]